MTERRDPTANLPLFAHADACAVARDDRRRAVHGRRLWRHVRFAGAILGFTLLGITIAAPPRPRLVWNASASAPVGLYVVSPVAPLARGDMVIAWAPSGPRALAAARHYLPANVPLVKRVRGVPGDRVCAIGRTITVNGAAVAGRRRRDAAGRTMPRWRGCVTLDPASLLLLNDAPASFDGRYFGPSHRSEIVGKATPLWVR